MVNGVSFAATRGIYDKTNLDAPQANSRQTTTTQPAVKPKKSHKTAKVIAGTLATVAVAATELALGSKFGVFDPAKVGKVLGGLKDAKWLQWAKEPAKTALKGLDTAGNFVKEYAGKGYNAVVEYAGKGIDAVKNFFSRNPAAAPADPVA